MRPQRGHSQQPSRAAKGCSQAAQRHSALTASITSREPAAMVGLGYLLPTLENMGRKEEEPR
jgi:hypothetical protein